MSLDALFRRLQRFPMLKIALCVVGGILLHRLFALPIGGLILLFALAAWGSIRYQHPLCYLTALLAAGYLLAAWHDRPVAPLPKGEAMLRVEVLDDGTRRTRTNRYEAQLLGWQELPEGVEHQSEGRLWLYADTLHTLHGGEQLRFEGRIDPFAQDTAVWAQQMARKGYLGRCYMASYHTPQRIEGRTASLHLWAARTLDKRLEGRTDNAAALMHAMTIGNRTRLTPTLRESYARSGFSHLVALSGLHVGMLFLVVNLLLGWLKLLHRGHRIQHLLAIAVVWLFVAVAGFPISAIRAAVMCTLLQWALFSSAPYRAVNSWAAAALLLLAYNPAWLFDIGFQLSFLAVGGILLVGLPLCRRVRGGNRLLNLLTDALLISITASLFTMPLAAHHFGLWPLAGIVMNPPAILLATGVVACSLLLLVLPPLAPLLRPLALGGAAALNYLAEEVASMTALCPEFRPSGAMTGAIYLFFVLLILAAWCREPKKM